MEPVSISLRSQESKTCSATVIHIDRKAYTGRLQASGSSVKGATHAGFWHVCRCGAGAQKAVPQSTRKATLSVQGWLPVLKSGSMDSSVLQVRSMQ